MLKNKHVFLLTQRILHNHVTDFSGLYFVKYVVDIEIRVLEYVYINNDKVY